MGYLVPALLIITGAFFCLVAAIGMVRLPDTLTRMHAATKAGTLGAGLILASAAIWFDELGLILRTCLTLLFIFLTAPVAAHIIGRVAYRSCIELSERTWVDHLSEDIPNSCVAEKTDP